ncbi:tRNA-splicing ligase RtcB [Chlamydiales bacterium STE3]|nr:tRNA-splicing ligase RtcB [Chlamydiales bacterium STE3]
MSMFNLKKIHPATYLVPQEKGMRVPGLVIGTEELFAECDIEKPLEQLRHVAYLPGITGYSIAMPDIHWGYGFPIGGVAAMDAETGVISPGGVGYDINCGVRIAIAPIPFQSINKTTQLKLLKKAFSYIPSGVGHGHKKEKGLADTDYRHLIEQGARWSIEKGFGFLQDLDHMESNGLITGGDVLAVSELAKHRGRQQLGSIGSGNHFVEIGSIDTIFLPEIAKEWRVELGRTYILIHSGSRGFGHQVCQDTLNEFIKQGYAEGLPDRQLVAAPITSLAGQHYFAAMAAAANFAFNNRQQILHHVRRAFKEVLKINQEDVRLIYDVCHNIAKFESYEVEGEIKKLCVHRKGATRAFGPSHPELSPLFQKTGQPVLVPGDMGRASHLMAGSGNPLTWCSACHGAGRAKSRVQSLKNWSGRDLIDYMSQQGITVMANSSKTIAEEMPDAYKDVESVVEAVQKAGLARMVARLKPHLVIKG